ncbi:MAG TPA: hypothetical protein VF633_04195 [Brevundimonas sp.]|jgi:ABC-type transport system involved in cytochrome c biogenesis permease subunit
MADQPGSNRAVFKLKAGKVSMAGKLEVSTAGLFAIGVMVSSILGSAAGVVWVATSVARKRL